MLASAIILFREAIEIAMILGIILVATRGLPGRGIWIAGGVLAGVAGAGLIAVFAEAIASSLEGMGQEYFNAAILFTAALFIGWTAIWIRKNARQMSAHFRQIGAEVSAGKLPLYTLSIIVGLAMLREGAEIVLFIYGMSLSGQTTASIVSGCVIGLTAGTCCGLLLYYGLLKIPARYMLRVTSGLLILLVAGLAAQGANYLSAAGMFSDFSATVWDSSWLLSDSSVLGKTLHSLIGYSAQPTQIQLAVYLGSLLVLMGLIWRIEARAKALVTSPQPR